MKLEQGCSLKWQGLVSWNCCAYMLACLPWHVVYSTLDFRPISTQSLEFLISASAIVSEVKEVKIKKFLVWGS